MSARPPCTHYLLFACILSITTACADYERGYEHGYKNRDAQIWYLIGRSDYNEGYQEGQMQAFQDSWYAENADEIIVGKACPTLLTRSSMSLYVDGLGYIDIN